MLTCTASVSHQGEFSTLAVENAARQLRDSLGGPADLAIAFFTPDFLPHLAEFSDIIRVDGHISELVGSTGTGTIFNAFENEGGSGFSILALRSTGSKPIVITQSTDDLRCGGEVAWMSRNLPVTTGIVLMANPFHFPAEDWLAAFNQAFPGTPVVGGLASGGSDEASMAVFHNHRIVEGAVLLGFRGDLQLIPVVSQGCRPIGEPLPVTKAEHNVVYSLGTRPAYQALEAAFESLTDAEKSGAQGNLFVGLANNEYVDEFKSGDFLIRNIIGADPGSGAVVIAGIPRLGQTLQYQIRDRDAADSDLKRALNRSWNHGYHEVLGSLIFSCTGRGTGMFETSNHDAAAVQLAAGKHPSAGFFCNGEVGPVSNKNCSHTYTASIALLCVKREQH